MATIAFIGLGIMGAPMAGHLIAAGHDVLTSTSHKQPPADLVAAGLRTVGTDKAASAAAELIILMVPDTPQVGEVLFGGDDCVAQALGPGKTVIDMSSISPIATREFATKVAALGATYLDAPVSGGEAGARAASLTIMCGGDEADFKRVLPILELMGKNITLVGEVGSGQVAKIANQIIVALNIEAVAEALVFASKAGADPEKVRQALLGGFASSRVLEVHGERMIKRTFNPGFRIELHQKDLNLALEGGRAMGVSLPNTANAQQLFSSVGAHGGKGLDHSALVKALEYLADHEV
jgi:2-hydroxy-3-oxopropionate reductase